MSSQPSKIKQIEALGVFDSIDVKAIAEDNSPHNKLDYKETLLENKKDRTASAVITVGASGFFTVLFTVAGVATGDVYVSLVMGGGTALTGIISALTILTIKEKGTYTRGVRGANQENKIQKSSWLWLFQITGYKRAARLINRYRYNA